MAVVVCKDLRITLNGIRLPQELEDYLVGFCVGSEIGEIVHLVLEFRLDKKTFLAALPEALHDTIAWSRFLDGPQIVSLDSALCCPHIAVTFVPASAAITVNDDSITINVE